MGSVSPPDSSVQEGRGSDVKGAEVSTKQTYFLCGFFLPVGS